MYVYSTYFHVIGVIIKTRPLFVLDLEAGADWLLDFNKTVNDTDALKAKYCQGGLLLHDDSEAEVLKLTKNFVFGGSLYVCWTLMFSSNLLKKNVSIMK